MGYLIDYFFTWTDGFIGQTHLVFATIALLAGACVLLLRKGTRAHSMLGYAYLISMLTLNVTALMKYDLTGAPNMFHIFSVLSLLTISGSYIAILMYKRGKHFMAARAHGELMIWSYFGLVMALIAEVVTRGFPYMLHGEGGWLRFSAALFILMAIGAFFTHRFIRRELFKTFGR